MLFDSVQNVAEAKNIEDKHVLREKQLEENLNKLNADNELLLIKNQQLMSERDQFRKETKELLEIKDKIQLERTTAFESFKKRLT